MRRWILAGLVVLSMAGCNGPQECVEACKPARMVSYKQITGDCVCGHIADGGAR